MKALTVIIGMAASLLAAPASAEPPRAVLELFTSQGCSSCPKADRLAAELAKDENVIVLTFPVDYWDYLGWKDTLGSAAHSARQRAYAVARGDRKVFTPQMVVNGLASATGSDAQAISEAIRNTSRTDGVLSIPVSVDDAGGQIGIFLDKGTRKHSEVWLVALSSKRTVTIEAGENEAQSVTYTNVVRKMTRVGSCNGKTRRFTVPRADAIPADADSYLVLVQEGSGSMPGPIVGVAHRTL